MRHALMLCTVILMACGADESTTSRAASPVTDVRVLRDTAGFTTGPLQLTSADGRIDTVAVEAIRAWRLAEGTEIAWSGRDGGGGFENEGHALRLAVVDSIASPRLTLREPFMIEAVEELRDREGRRLLAVAMVDGGAGMPHLVLVDPARGVVYRAVRSRIAERGDTLTIEHLEPEGSTLPSIVEMVTIRELLVRPLLTP
jgi:hypothetical protein